MDEGDRIRLSGEGEAGVNGGPPGDLYVVIHIKRAPGLHSATTTICTARCRSASPRRRWAARSRFPTLDGYAKIKVPPETQTGKVFRLRGKGIKGVRAAAHGDLLCHVVVETPVNLTARQRELLRSSRRSTRRTPAGTIRGPSPGWRKCRSFSRSSLRSLQSLRLIYGRDDIRFTFVSDEFNGVTRDNQGNVRPLKPRTFRSLSQAEEENGQSRMYLGIHWHFDKTSGIAQGRQVANYVFENAFQSHR